MGVALRETSAYGRPICNWLQYFEIYRRNEQTEAVSRVMSTAGGCTRYNLRVSFRAAA